MEHNAVFLRIRNEARSFFEAVGKTSETIYLILITIYVAIFYLLKIQWTGRANTFFDSARYAALAVVMWGTALYLLFVIVEWKKLWNNTIALILIGAVILGLTYFFSKRMSTNAYGVVMDVLFCVLVYKKDFRKILKCLLGVSVSMLLIAGIGMALGFTRDVGKPETSLPGHSLGINYPNTWGYLVFLGLIIFWYLYLRFKPLFTFAFFWSVSAFMYYYIICRTIAGFTLIFPLCASGVDWLEKRMDRRAEEGKMKRIKPLEWIVTAIPFIAWLFMMISSYAVDWWYQYYHGPLRNLAWRFIQGGLYFRTYGLPLVGNPYRSNKITYINVQDEFIKVGILDSSFAAYIIMRGILWLCYTLIWLCVAIYKAFKKRDYAIILIEVFFLGFAMMERPGLEMWYNFILLYPLAKVVSKQRTEKVLEFDAPEYETIEIEKVKEVKGYVKEYKAFMKIDSFPKYHLEKQGDKMPMETADESKSEPNCDSLRAGYDFEKKRHCLQLPVDIDVSKDAYFHEFTRILDNEQYVNGDKDMYDTAVFFTEYHAAQTQLLQLMGFGTVDDYSEVSMNDQLNVGMTVSAYFMEKHETAVDLFRNPQYDEDAEWKILSVMAFYNFLGYRSVCEMYVRDYDKSAYDYSVFKEKLGAELYNQIDNHMHGMSDKVLFNICKGDYRDICEKLGLSNEAE